MSTQCRSFTVLASLGLLLSGPCAGQQQAPERPPAWAAPPLDLATSVRDGTTGEALSLPALYDALAQADVVFLGETHTDETTHRMELAVYEALLQRRHDKVVLAMEMFERDAQSSLDAYLAGKLDEVTFVHRASVWSNYTEAYRPLIQRAARGHLPVVASNFPRSLRRRMMMSGPEVLDQLDDAERAQAPQKLLPSTDAYWRRVDNAIRGHLAMMRAAGGDRLYSTQSLWDNTMGESCARALDAHPGWAVLHVNGGFHSAYHDGTVRQLRLRKPGAAILTVSLVPTVNPTTAELSGVPVADFVVFVERRAADVEDGTYSVTVPHKVEYDLSLPDAPAAGQTVPLLIWLADDGTAPADAMALWRRRLGNRCAIAVLHAPHRETEPDLVEGGRWFWPDSFMTDVDVAQEAIERCWAYLLRHHAIDTDHVCVAGEGTGATIAAALAVHGERVRARVLAVAPRHFVKLRDLPLPLPELAGDDPRPDTSLRVLAPARDGDWWQQELTDGRAVGLSATLAVRTDDPWLREFEEDNAVRAALGLPAQPAPAARRHMVVSGVRARTWARLRALDHEKEALVAILDLPPAGTTSTAIPLDLDSAALGRPGAVPRCPGPFGGTTVLVLPDGVGGDELEAWRKLEENDPLAAHSRFYRLRIATRSGPRALGAVLDELLEKGRKNVLIVPAVFCADADTMRALARLANDHADRMTLHWLPGLGRPGDS